MRKKGKQEESKEEGTEKKERTAVIMSRLKCTPCSSYRDLEQQAGCRVTITEMTRRTELALLCDRTREMEAGL